MSTPADDKVPDPDVILNRINVAHARSLRLLQSWLPPKSEQDPATQSTPEDDDFTSMTEIGGYGSKAAHADDASDGLIPRRKTTSQDMLLEQILGKKGARAKKRKDAENARDKKAEKLGVSKPLVKRPGQGRKMDDGSEDDDEGGRSSAFESRRVRSAGAGKAEMAEVRAAIAGTTDVDTTTATATPGTLPQTGDNEPAGESEREERAPKRKKGSYLDEVLAQKSKKKSKKNKPSAGG